MASGLTKSFKSWTWFAFRVSPALHTTWGAPKVGTPRFKDVDNPNFLNCGSSEWGAGSSPIKIGPDFDYDDQFLKFNAKKLLRERENENSPAANSNDSNTLLPLLA